MCRCRINITSPDSEAEDYIDCSSHHSSEIYFTSIAIMADYDIFVNALAVY